ncbi:sulfatase family protein [Cyclobacterium qasimii]|uniref:Arylsulfatase n=2 Tax=Cyclobacterium qasimii TaxID=1350429 RepID=S7WJN8_9BACT|nr:sulfatase-like hydrolase/transferase [Cyclobacterium qasimii]EPR66934.1 Arylsulfatase [Cyclobacterium qasimii M12-11B]GEO20189.1 arylsulfatase [Cyclobacterium qasimii]
MKTYILPVFLLIFNLSNGFSQGDSTPNIIYILADDMGIGDASCYNPEGKLETIHIDKMANKGIKFTDAHTSSAVCTPTRYGILTGRYNWRSTLKSSVLGGFSAPLIDSERFTVGKLLQGAGYHTGFIGKWHLGWDWAFKQEYENIDNLNTILEVDYSQPIKNGPNQVGFTYAYGFSSSLDIPPYVYIENDRVTALPEKMTVNVDDKGFWRKGPTAPDFEHVQVLSHLTEKAVNFIDENANKEQPFFLYFPLPAPHTPILPTTEFMGKSNTNMYGDFVLQVDDVVGKIVAELERKGVLENTLLIFTSDNGCSPKANFAELAKVGHDPSDGFRGHKADIYEGGHRVPFIVQWPAKIAGGKTTDQIICTTDFMSTVAAILDQEMPENAGEDSFSFLKVLNGDMEAEVRPSVIHHSIEGRFAIRKSNWKLIAWPGSGGWTAPRSAKELVGLPDMQLFDLSKDPGEQTNLINDFPEVASLLKKEMISLIKNGRSTAGPKLKNDGPEVWPQVEWAYEAQ